MSRLSKHLFFTIIFAALGLAGAVAAKADPLAFSNVVALQNNNTIRVDLLSNPGVTLMGPRVSFLVDITGTLPRGVTNILSITYSEEGSVPETQTFSIPAFGTIPPPFTQLFTFTSPGANYLGVAATLTVAIFGSASDLMDREEFGPENPPAKWNTQAT